MSDTRLGMAKLLSRNWFGFDMRFLVPGVFVALEMSLSWTTSRNCSRASQPGKPA
jgi:hypothetical protein